MSRLWAALRIFFRTLSSRHTAEEVGRVLAGLPIHTPSPAAPVAPPPPTPVAPPPPVQNPAVTLLATLQREARLIDFLQEDLAAYTDAQIGAAAREVQRDSAKVLKRIFALQPVVDQPDGATVEVVAGFDAGRYRLTGQLGGAGPWKGALRHHGWETTRCDLPTFTGSKESAGTVAPAEVEIGASA